MDKNDIIAILISKSEVFYCILQLIFSKIRITTLMDANDILTLFIATLALIVSTLTYLDSKFNFKLDTAVGKHIKLNRINVDGISYPLIMMNVSFINNGGKTDTIEDTKLIVELSGNGITTYDQEFITAREFTDIFNDMAPSTEILPIVVNGKSTTVKKYAFQAFPNMSQALVPSVFNIKCTLYVKYRGKWIKQKNYRSLNISGVWQDLNSTTTVTSKIINLEELNL